MKNGQQKLAPNEARVTIREMIASTYVELVNGQIAGKVDLPHDGMIDLTTVNGAVALDIPHNTSADFSAGVSNGRIELSNPTLRSEERTTTSLQGRLGDGRGMITLRTVNGDIGVRGY